MNQGHGITIVGDSVFDGCTNQAFSAFFGARLDADAAMFRETNLRHAHLITQEFDHFFSFGAVGFPLDARIDVFGVFTEDNHVGQFRVFNRAWRARVVTHRAQTHVQVKLLAQRNVQGTNTATDRGSQRAFDGNAVITNQVQSFFWQPDILAIQLGRFFAGIDFHPGNFPLALIGFLYGGIHHFNHGWRHIHTDTITFNERNDWVVRDVQFAILQGDLLTFRRNDYFAFH
ncbi:hypothetical protein D3C72_1350360 [compost metagenome]